MIVIIDYGMGNLGSLFNMLKKVGASALISAKLEDIARAEKLILPGVGAFDNAMKKIKELDLIPLLQEKVVEQKTPLLGICLGMQLLTQKSAEGNLPGLGWIAGDTVRFNFQGRAQDLKIPHMGWNTVQLKKSSPLWEDMEEEPRFYFVHSYHVVCSHPEDVLTETTYGYNFVSAVVRDNIAGMQFHPEKSHKFGMKIFKNFVEKF
jgi:imidazole glycerol-phosphate synthase subunit HisH